MSASDILIILIFTTFLSLILVSIANVREKRRRTQRQKLNSLKGQVIRLEQLATTLDGLLENPSLIRYFNVLILENIDKMKSISAIPINFEAIYQATLARAEALEEQEWSSHLDRLKESDSQIAKSLKNIEEAAILIKRQSAAKKINGAQMNLFLKQLSWAHLMVGVISFVGQGHKAVHKKNILSAHAFYKKAQQLLLNSSNPDQRRHAFIKQLSELIAGNRRAISNDLMPETHLNPAPFDDENANLTD